MKQSRVFLLSFLLVVCYATQAAALGKTIHIPTPSDEIASVPGRPSSNRYRSARPEASANHADRPNRAGVILFAGVDYNNYLMGDMNDELAELRTMGVPIDDIDGGSSFHFGIRLMPDEQVQFGMNYRRLNGETAYSDGSGSLKFDVSANVYEFIALLRMIPSPQFNVYGGIGAGHYVADGYTKLVIEGIGAAHGDLYGKKIGFRPFLEGQFLLDLNLRIGLHLGYRFAKLGPMRVENTTIEDYYLDYSGFEMGVSFLLFLFPGKQTTNTKADGAGSNCLKKRNL